MLPLFSVLVLVLGLLRLALRCRRRPRLPPGPSGKLLIGNLLDVPTKHEWLRYAEYARTYGTLSLLREVAYPRSAGDIVCLRVLGQTLIILSSENDIKELLATRGAIYSGRMRGAMVQSVGEGVLVLPLGRPFRAIRRIFSSLLGPLAIRRCSDVQAQAVIQCLRRLVDQQQDPVIALKRMIGGAVLQLAYGYEVKSDDDHFVQLAEKSAFAFLSALQPGWVVDTFPALMDLPSWLPFTGFKRKVELWRQDAEQGLRAPWDWVKSRLASGVATPSFAAELMDHKDEDAARMALRDIYGAGMDTTLTASLWLILALALHPDVQIRAQREIDAVTLGERLPTLDDRGSLPYIDAIVKEVMRWHPTVPLAVPHIVTEEDTYHGYRIPKGSIVIANVWSILHDPQKYPDPEMFRPERHLSHDVKVNPNPYTYAFGFGPRQCPGRNLADTTLYLLASSVLATCTVSSAVSSHNEILTPESLEYTSGTISRPAPFHCRMTPRSEQLRALLYDGFSD
ncbi:cytochrome P450 [Auricularia subglabra TFB-10046 SS5]|uniref:Cytochrome P450 n=1 Tax=Auricularia subglabra (strain TFB-10046 / SS5) TaxID=717982 RepID=J0WVI2_AURST|nr:cytochrome P450 [Auricularia subglabra TFB-10046 SS5]